MNRFKNYFDLVKRHASDSRYHGVMRQLAEMAAVFLLRRIGPGFYLMAEMNKKEYDWRYKLGFFNGKEYVRRINKINDPNYYSTTFNKVVEKSILRQFNLPTPRFLGCLNEKGGLDNFGKSISSAKDLSASLERSGLKKICFKLLSDYGGRGFRATEILKQNGVILLRDLDGKHYNQVEEYLVSLNLSKFGGYLIEEYFQQHEQLAQLNSTSVNTLRVMVYQKDGEKAKCLGAFLKIGRLGKLVDNGMAGGILAKVDMVSARLEKGFFSSSREYVFDIHPDSKTPINGFEVPFLDDAVALACKSLEVFPGIYFAGVDVAIGNGGPTLIELNARADHVDFAIINIPSRNALRYSV